MFRRFHHQKKAQRTMDVKMMHTTPSVIDRPIFVDEPGLGVDRGVAEDDEVVVEMESDRVCM